MLDLNAYLRGARFFGVLQGMLNFDGYLRGNAFLSASENECLSERRSLFWSASENVGCG